MSPFMFYCLLGGQLYLGRANVWWSDIRFCNWEIGGDESLGLRGGDAGRWMIGPRISARLIWDRMERRPGERDTTDDQRHGRKVAPSRRLECELAWCLGPGRNGQLTCRLSSKRPLLRPSKNPLLSICCDPVHYHVETYVYKHTTEDCSESGRTMAG